MNPALAARVSAAVAKHLFVPVEVRAPDGAGGFTPWRTVQGQERKGSAEQQPSSFVGAMIVNVHELSLLTADFSAGHPAARWQVRFTDGRVLFLSEPPRLTDAAGKFLVAPLVPL